jgi:hypothetical protein
VVGQALLPQRCVCGQYNGRNIQRNVERNKFNRIVLRPHGRASAGHA